VLWRGGGLDRLLDERHVRLVAAAAERLRRSGWDVTVEATYSVYGERGSIDVLGAHQAHGAVVVEEVKSEIVSIEALGRKTDEKVRLVRNRLALERFGWRPRVIGRVLGLPDSETSRRAVRLHQGLVRAMFPASGIELRRWLERPDGDIGAILFLPGSTTRAGTRRLPGSQRVRRAATSTNGPQS
jgi:hypothetical protein